MKDDIKNGLIKEIFELYEKKAFRPEFKELIKDLKEMYFEKEEYKSRNEKALEKLYFYNDKENNMYVPVDEIINILQGSDR